MLKKDLITIVETAACDYSGNVDQLMSAIGMLHIGYFYGWRFLYIAFSKKTVANYEKILGIKFRTELKELGDLAFTSEGLANALAYDNFWKVASGDIKITDRKTLTHPQIAAASFHHPI